MGHNRRAVGTEYERRAGLYLQQQGYEILRYNYRCKKGEVDIIARDGEYLVFCEVKYRSGRKGGDPSEAVDHRKQKILSGCALYYLMETGMTDIPCRFDVVGIAGGEVRLYKNAFDYMGGF